MSAPTATRARLVIDLPDGLSRADLTAASTALATGRTAFADAYGDLLLRYEMSKDPSAAALLHREVDALCRTAQAMAAIGAALRRAEVIED